VAVTSSTNPSTFGHPVTFTATVTAGAGTPMGTVTFLSGTTASGTATLTGGSATFTTSALAVGAHPITVVYGGDDSFSGNTSPELSQVVDPARTSTEVTSSTNPSTFGQPVTFTATVTSPGGTPAGTVAFKDGMTTLGAGTLTGGVATFTTASLAAGSHTITSEYEGSGSFRASASAVLAQEVERAVTTTALTSSLNPSTFGQAVTFTVAVTSPAGTPTGVVTLLDGTTALGTVPLAVGGATLATSGLAVGSHAITAVYGGDASFEGSASAAISQTVNAVITAIHDVGEVGFKTKKSIHLLKDGHGPFPIDIDVRNFGTATETIGYAVSSTASVALSGACSGTIPAVPPKSSVAVQGCTVVHGDADSDPVLTLTVTHDDADGGTDSKPSNDTRQVAIKVKD